jgi:hypothetical protein
LAVVRFRGALAGVFAAPAPVLFDPPAAAFVPDAAGLASAAGFAAAVLRAPDDGVRPDAADSFEAPEPAGFFAAAAPVVRFGADEPAAAPPAAARVRGERGAPVAPPAAPPVAPPAAVSGAPVLGESAVCGSSGRSPSDGGCGVLMRLPPLP